MMTVLVLNGTIGIPCPPKLNLGKGISLHALEEKHSALIAAFDSDLNNIKETPREDAHKWVEKLNAVFDSFAKKVGSNPDFD